MGAGAGALSQRMQPYTTREVHVRIPFIPGICVFTISRIPPIDAELLEPPVSSSGDDYDQDYDYGVFEVSDTEHWLANDGQDMDI